MGETVAAIRDLNEHPDTIFTVLTGEGRFFSAGADVRGKALMTFSVNKNLSRATGSGLETSDTNATATEKKLAFMARFAPGGDLCSENT